MSSETLERFVDVDEVANFLSLTRRRVLDLARDGLLPAYPIGNGSRRVWRFRLTEVAAYLRARTKSGVSSEGKAVMVRTPRILRG